MPPGLKDRTARSLPRDPSARNGYPRPMDNDIRTLLDICNLDDDLAESARRYLDDYRVFCLARPKPDHVAVQQALLKTRLKELLRAARRDGLLG